MKGRRLEDALDECLSAYLDGRRSIEESLSLYPSLRSRLEPLLRTAVDIEGTLANSSPPPHLARRGREEFLTRASNRRRAASLTPDNRLSRRIVRAVRSKTSWTLFAGTIAVAFAAITVAIPALDSAPDGPKPEALRPATSDDALAPTVGDLREAQEQLWRRANQGSGVSPAMIRELARTTAELEAQIEDFSALDSRSRAELERTIADQFVLLHLIVDTQPPDVAPEAREALELTEQLALAWGVELPDLPGGGTAAASPEATPAHTAAASPSPAPVATRTPAPEATATPSPAPAGGA